MLDLKVICDIRKNAVNSILTDSDDEIIKSVWKKIIYVLTYYILPLGASSIAFWRNITLSSMQSYIGTGIAIFTGLFFSLLLSIGAKVRAEKENVNRDNANFQRYKTSMKQIANIILYIIVLGIIIFLIMILNSILKSANYPCVEKIFTAIALFLLGQFIVSLFFMIQRFYFLVRDEINNIL